MSVIVKNMEMPKNCVGCPICCGLPYQHRDEKGRRPDCPLIEIPTPHGVLKDTTAFDERIRDQYCKKCERRFGIKNGKRKEVYEIGGVPCRACDIGDMLDWLDDTETVIEAEGNEE